MIRWLLFAFAFAVSVALCVAAFIYGSSIPFSQQWPLYEALRNTAAIIFAVVGAWLAIIYPERLKLSFRRSSVPASSNGNGNSNIALLMTPAVHSTIILVILLLVGVVGPLLKQVPQLSAYANECRGISYLLLTILTLWQVLIVIMTIAPADMVKSMVDEENAKKEIQKQFGKLQNKK